MGDPRDDPVTLISLARNSPRHKGPGVIIESVLDPHRNTVDIGHLDGPIDYINPHATSTPVGDRMEIQAIREVFGDAIPPISATKSLTGHSQGATGVHEAIYSLLMMRHGFIAKSAHIDEIDPEFADIPIVRERMDGVKLDRVLSNSFGFGGTNACLAFQRVTD